MSLKPKLKRAVFRLLGKDPEAVVVSFLSGEAELARRMAEEVVALVPGRRHFRVAVGEPAVAGAIVLEAGSTWQLYRQLRRHFGRFRVGLAPVLFTRDSHHAALQRAAILLAPGKVLAYNARLERHHLRLRTVIASWLFLRGVPLDRIFLRPRWLCPWRKDRTVIPAAYRVLDGRPLEAARRRIAILSPYYPYPLSHGGAVRIFHLLREAARRFDVFLFAFTEKEEAGEPGPVLDTCAKVVLVQKPRYREPSWSTLTPPEVCEYRSPVMRRLIEEFHREHEIELLQVEYTCLAGFGGDILVEHDVTWDLYRQVWEREGTLAAWWDFWRWRRYEERTVRRYRRVAVMSDKDAAMLGVPHARVIPNGVDLERFRPEPERAGQRLLFVGSFRHFPNAAAYRFFAEQVWPRLRDEFPEMTVTVVAGPDPLLYWRAYAGTEAPPRDDRIRLLEFIADVRPLYIEANLVLVPTLVSAGTNVKVIEALAMERAVVSTPSGCAGLGLTHGESVWIAEVAEAFAAGIATLIRDPQLRHRIALAARLQAEQRFDWRQIGEAQRTLFEELLPQRIVMRRAGEHDLDAITRIQQWHDPGSSWEPRSYLKYDCQVAEVGGRVAGLVVTRKVSEGESEILYIAVDSEFQRRRVGEALLRKAIEEGPGDWFLEVRASNQPARKLYKKLGFKQIGLRPDYYHNPTEAAVVMRRAATPT